MEFGLFDDIFYSKKSIGIHQVFSEVAKKSLTDKSCMVERQEVKRKCSANVHNDNYFGHYLQTVKEPGRCIKLFGGQKACVSAEYMDPVTTQCDDDVATSVQ